MKLTEEKVLILEYYNREVKPFWNNICQKLSDGLFLPNKNKNNFDIKKTEKLITHIFPTFPVEKPFSLNVYNEKTKKVEVKTTHKIRFYFNNAKQRNNYTKMLQVARRAYNLTVDLCNNEKYKDEETGEKIDLRVIVREIVRKEMEEEKAVFDVNVCDEAVREAINDFKSVCNKNKTLKEKGKPSNVSYSTLGFKSRKSKKQTFSHPRLGVKGVCHRSLGRVYITEEIPKWALDRNVEVTLDHERWFMCVQKKIIINVPDESQISNNKELKEVKCIALDPGSRTFMTGFTPEYAVKYGEDFSVNALLPLAKKMRKLYSLQKKLKSLPCYACYDEKEENRPDWLNHQLRSIEKKLNRLECIRQDRVDELHKTVAFHLVSHFDVIYLPSFDTKDMVNKETRNIGRKAVHNMLSLKHYEFKQFLIWTARKYNKKLFIINESYTSKTHSWSGFLDEKLKDKKWVSDDVIKVDRDINGARNIYIKHICQCINKITAC